MSKLPLHDMIPFNLSIRPAFTVFCNVWLGIQLCSEVPLSEPFSNQLNGYVHLLSLQTNFFTHAPQHVHMHQHIAHPPGPEPSPGIIDNISDTLLNAFARVRKPDERFLSMRENVDKFEDGLVMSERLWNRVRGRTSGKFHLHMHLRVTL